MTPRAATLRVATYNVHACIGTDGRHDPDRVAAVVGELDADVVALQEFTYPASVAIESSGAGGAGRPWIVSMRARPDATSGDTVLRKRLTGPASDRRRAPDRPVDGRREPRGALAATIDVGGRPCTCWRPISDSASPSADSRCGSLVSRFRPSLAGGGARRFQRLAAWPIRRARARSTPGPAPRLRRFPRRVRCCAGSYLDSPGERPATRVRPYQRAGAARIRSPAGCRRPRPSADFYRERRLMS